MTRSTRIAAVAVAVALATVIPASAQERGLTCLHQCQSRLKNSGLWRAYPYGYCRKKCGLWGPAEKYQR